MSAAPKTPYVRDQVSAEEWQIRTDLAATYRLVAHHGWADMIFTHITARVPGPEHHFLINPYGLMFDEITASSLVNIDIDGKKVMESPYPVNPAGFTIHSAIHGAREDAHAVIHVHTADGVAVSCQEQGFLPMSQHAMLVYDDVAYHDYEGVALDLDERDRLIKDMGKKHLMILRNHGTLTVGKTCADAFLRLYYLERACTIQVRALAGGPKINPTHQGVEEKTAGQGGMAFDGLIGNMAWPGLLRLLDRKDPSYRN